jgi:hypothetical protein
MIHACGVASAAPQFPILTDEPRHYVFVTTGLFAWLALETSASGAQRSWLDLVSARPSRE